MLKKRKWVLMVKDGKGFERNLNEIMKVAILLDEDNNKIIHSEKGWILIEKAYLISRSFHRTDNESEDGWRKEVEIDEQWEWREIPVDEKDVREIVSSILKNQKKEEKQKAEKEKIKKDFPELPEGFKIRNGFVCDQWGNFLFPASKIAGKTREFAEKMINEFFMQE
jgi:hypothetical protein